MLSSMELHGWRQGKTIDLYGRAGISATGEVWLTCNADTQCTLEGREEAQRGREKFYF